MTGGKKWDDLTEAERDWFRDETTTQFTVSEFYNQLVGDGEYQMLDELVSAVCERLYEQEQAEAAR